MRSAVLLFIAILSCFLGHTQDANNLALDANVKDQDGGKLAGVDIVVIQDGALVEKVKTRNNGRFDLLLDFDHEYIIEANRPGFVSKRMYVNTNNVPEDEQLWGYEYGGFAIDLFKNIEGVDFSILDKPVAKIYYDPNVQNFTYDKTYTKQIKQQLDELLNEYEKKAKIQDQLLAQKDEDYDLAIKDAENAFEDGDFLVAKENYLAAASLKPGESVPKKKLKEIENKINAVSNKEDQYMSLLATADQLFAEEKFDAAKAKFQEASSIKPDEDYPKTKLKASEKASTEKKKRLDEEALLAEKDRKYNEQIDKGDKEFTSGKYQNAKTYYQNALGFKPSEDYPKNQISASVKKINEEKDQLLKAQDLARLTEKYNAQIAKADAAFKSDNYENALLGYNKAKIIKPDESYPNDQIALITKTQLELAENERLLIENQAKDKAYEGLLADANNLLKRGEYEEARSTFESALEKRPNDDRPRSKLEEINKILLNIQLKDQKEKEIETELRQYESLVELANEELESQDLNSAKSNYLKALDLRPSEQYPKNQIKVIESLLKEQDLEARFKEQLTSADAAFARKDYDSAIASYQKASVIKTKDLYPKNQIDVINSLRQEEKERKEELAKNAKTEEVYAELILQADGFFGAEEYSSAISKYEEAKQFTLNVDYVDNQIASSEQKRKEKLESDAQTQGLAEQEEKYQDAITKADNYLDEKDYNNALTKYNQAASLNNEKVYPKEQIELISGLINDERLAREKAAETAETNARQAELSLKYEEAIKMADRFMGNEDYQRAKLKYKEAYEIDQSNSYAQNQKKSIENLLAEMKNASEAEEMQRLKYNDLLKTGDQAVVSGDWNQARDAFRNALEIYPAEKVPASRLKEIDQLESNEKEDEMRQLFNETIEIADALFLSKDLDAALEKYNESLTLKDDPHANARVAKIKELKDSKPDDTIEKTTEKRQVTEETFKEGNAQVTIRTISVGSRVDIYKRVVHSWGGKYYFLNDQPIPELIWNRDSE